jgi:hypothetical protein
MVDRQLNESLTWRSAGSGGDNCSGGVCVEVASLPGGGVAIRDSKNGARGPVHRFSRAEWDAFRNGIKQGRFDDL